MYIRNKSTIYKYYFIILFLLCLTQCSSDIKRKGGHLDRLLRLCLPLRTSSSINKLWLWEAASFPEKTHTKTTLIFFTWSIYPDGGWCTLLELVSSLTIHLKLGLSLAFDIKSKSPFMQIAKHYIFKKWVKFELFFSSLTKDLEKYLKSKNKSYYMNCKHKNKSLPLYVHLVSKNKSYYMNCKHKNKSLPLYVHVVWLNLSKN